MKISVPVFNFSASNQGSDVLEIYIDGDIVDAETQEMYQWYGIETSVSYKSLRSQVNGTTANTINFYINSGGGMVTDAMAIHDWIVEMRNAGKTVNTIGRGIVASAATYILMAGNSSMSANSWFMIHNVSGGTWGNVNDIENYAATLRKFNDSTRDFYANYTGLSAKVISDMMDAETWMTAEDAEKKKFIQKATPNVTFTNSISSDKWLYQNKTVLAAYNSSTVKNDTDMVDKIIEGIKNAFKEMGILKVDGAENKAVQPITNEALTAALTAALQPINDEVATLVKNAVTEGVAEFKTKVDGIDNQISEATKNFITADAIKDFATKNEVKTVNDELEATKKSIANKSGNEAKPNNTGGKPDADKFEHAGITWGE